MAVYVPNPSSPLGAPADLIENLGAEIASRFAEAEELMIAKVAKVTAKGGDATDAAERVRVLGDLRQEGARIAGRLADREFVAQLVAIAAADGEAAAVARLGLAGPLATTSGISGAAANAVGQVALSLSSSLEDMSARITRWMPDAYRHVISMTTTGVLTGAETLLESQRRAAERFLAMGVRGFEDAAGRQWRIGTYAEMASRTAIKRAWEDAHVFAAQEYAGVNLVTIVGGSNMCAKCAPHVGKVYATDGSGGGTRLLPHATEERSVRVTVVGDLSVARSAGWGHPNCRCVVVAYLPGLPIPKGSTYDPEAERNRDKLRALERDVRDAKRRLAATTDDVEAQRWKRKIRERQGKIRAHVNETGMLRRSYREQLHFSDGGPRPTRPPRAPRPVVSPPVLPRTGPTGGVNVPTPVPPVPRVPTPAPRPEPTPPALPTGDALEAAMRQIMAELEADKARTLTGLPKARAEFTDRAQAIVADLERQNTVADIAKVVRDAVEPLGINVSNLTGGLDIDGVRTYARTMVGLIAKYPRTRLVRFGAAQMGQGTYAHAGATVTRTVHPPATRAQIEAGKRWGDSSIEVSSSWAKAERRDEFLRSAAHDSHAGHLHDMGDANPWAYLVTHEFGHILDYAGQMRLAKELPAMRRAHQAETGRAAAEETSGYGRQKVAEEIAEAFADVEINGDAAKPWSKRVHARLIEIYEEETR